MSRGAAGRLTDMDRDSRRAAVAALAPLVGTWELEARFGDGPAQRGGRAQFTWALGGLAVEQRATVDHPEAPDVLAIIALDHDGAGFTQHYFDSRGVVRRYAMTFDGRTWTLQRTAADASPLDFSQRYVGTFAPDGSAIHGAWEMARDHVTFEKDFDLNYLRVP